MLCDTDQEEEGARPRRKGQMEEFEFKNTEMQRLFERE